MNGLVPGRPYVWFFAAAPSPAASTEQKKRSSRVHHVQQQPTSSELEVQRKQQESKVKSDELEVVWNEAQLKYTNLVYTKLDFESNKTMALSLDCTEAPSFAFWSRRKEALINPTPEQLETKLAQWNFS